MKKPNFFIIGAPKCGTTSLVSWLSDHPQVFMSERKEPNYFNTDMRILGAIRSSIDYEALFKNVRKQEKAIGEASTRYLRSKVAIPAILKYNPSAKFIVSLRNPIEMVASAHMHLVRRGVEPELSLKRAWEIQEERKACKHLPFLGIDGEFFQYSKICSLGEQVERLFACVNTVQVIVILLDDMKRDPRQEYNRLLNFLDIEDDKRKLFPKLNERQTPKHPTLARVFHAMAILKKKSGIYKRTHLGDFFYELNTKQVAPNSMDPEMRDILTSYFYNDIRKLEKLIDRDLSDWIAR